MINGFYRFTAARLQYQPATDSPIFVYHAHGRVWKERTDGVAGMVEFLPEDGTLTLVPNHIDYVDNLRAAVYRTLIDTADTRKLQRCRTRLAMYYSQNKEPCWTSTLNWKLRKHAEREGKA